MSHESMKTYEKKKKANNVENRDRKSEISEMTDKVKIKMEHFAERKNFLFKLNGV